MKSISILFNRPKTHAVFLKNWLPRKNVQNALTLSQEKKINRISSNGKANTSLSLCLQFFLDIDRSTACNGPSCTRTMPIIQVTSNIFSHCVNVS